MWFLLGVNTIKLDVSSWDKEDVEGWASQLVIYSTFDGRPPVEMASTPPLDPPHNCLPSKPL